MRKMKKDERYSHIKNLAYEFAYSGNGTDWLSIEHKLSAEGWTEARRILDNDSLRKELDSICTIANSPLEIENRESFKKWIGEFINSNREIIKQSYPDASVRTRENKFSISSSNKEIELSKKFNSRKLKGDRFTKESDGNRYVHTNYYESKKSFDEFTVDDLLELAKKL